MTLAGPDGRVTLGFILRGVAPPSSLRQIADDAAGRIRKSIDTNTTLGRRIEIQLGDAGQPRSNRIASFSRLVATSSSRLVFATLCNLKI